MRRWEVGGVVGISQGSSRRGRHRQLGVQRRPTTRSRCEVDFYYRQRRAADRVSIRGRTIHPESFANLVFAWLGPDRTLALLSLGGDRTHSAEQTTSDRWRETNPERGMS